MARNTLIDRGLLHEIFHCFMHGYANVSEYYQLDSSAPHGEIEHLAYAPICREVSMDVWEFNPNYELHDYTGEWIMRGNGYYIHPDTEIRVLANINQFDGA